MAEYLLMIRGSYAEWKAWSPEEKQRIMERYFAFARRLREEGRMRGGSGLTDSSVLLKLEGDKVLTVDGPYAETKEALTGYFLIEAKDREEAVRVARDCPALTHGETVEVVELSTA